MSVATTSKEAFKAITPKLGPMQKEVLAVIERVGPLNNTEIADFLGWEINRVTGRSKELSDLNMIEVAYTAPGRYGHNVKYWKATKEPEQTSLLDLAKELETS